MESRNRAGKGKAASQPRSTRRGRMPVERERKWAPEIGELVELSEKTKKEGLTRGDAQGLLYS